MLAVEFLTNIIKSKQLQKKTFIPRRICISEIMLPQLALNAY